MVIYKKYLKKIIYVLIGIFFMYSIYIQFEYRNYLNQIQDENYYYLSIISPHGNNLANRLEDFIQLLKDEEEIPDVKNKLFNNWRIVSGESKSIYSFVIQLSSVHIKDKSEAMDWSLIRYSLLRVDEYIDRMTNKFLEQQSYVISDEEKEKLEAIIRIYRAIQTETKNDGVDLKNILHVIKEPMVIIDEHYQNTLKNMGR